MHDVSVFFTHSGRVITDEQAFDRRIFFDDNALFAALWRFNDVHLFRFGTRWNGAEQLLHVRQNFISVEIAYQYESRITRMVPFVVIRLHFGYGSGFEVIKPADSGPMIGMLAEGGCPDFVF